jgi:signal transduction histidine kinase
LFRLSLEKLLVGINVSLVFVAAVCVALAASARLEHLADRQALARVQLAGSAAQKEISRIGEGALVSARLLAERPTLARLLRDGDRGSLAPFLEQFRSTSRLGGLAVVRGREILGRSGGSLPWDRIALEPASGKEQPFLLRLPGGALALAAVAPVPEFPGTRACAAAPLDRELERGISERVGFPVRILERESALAREGDPQADLRASALLDNHSVSGRLTEAGLYAADRPLRDPSGRAAGVVEAILERKEIAASLAELKRSLLILAVGVTAAAALLSVFIARRLARPLQDLTRASERIGEGDLSTPIPRASGQEVGLLSETMEEMRRRLLHLTAELGRRRVEAEAVLGGIVEAVFAVDSERRIRYLNPQAAALLGLTEERLLGRFCGDVLRPRGRGGVRPCEENCPIIHARFSGSARATERLLLPDGRQRSVVITSASAGARDPAAPAAAAEEVRQFQVIRDETEVEAVRRLRDAVLANISHEFKTPLTAQLASIELLRDRLHELGNPESEELVLSLERGTLRLTQLIDNLLESVRIEAGRHSIRSRSVALDEVVEEAMEMTAPLIAQRGQKLSVDLPFPLPPVIGDAPRLTQALVNLLANANKFSPGGTTIRIGGAAGSREVILWVEDEGPGLPGGAVASLFEPFARGPGEEDDEEPEQSGMGLGLWIVKSIVERHGGRVEVRGAGGPGGDGAARRNGDGAADSGPAGSTGTRVCVILPTAESQGAPASSGGGAS